MPFFRRTFAWWLSLCWLAGAGCAHGPLAAPRLPVILSADTTAYYDYPHPSAEQQQEFLGEHAGYAVQLVRWPLVPPPAWPTEGRSDISSSASTSDGLRSRPHAGGGMADRQPIPPPDAAIEVEWYESAQPGKRAALLVLPILGGNYPIERAFCRFFAYRGVHAALVRRRTIKFSASESPEDLEALLRRAVIRNRQVIDWLETQPSVDATRLGLFGISMGGIVGVMTAAVEPRVRATVAGLAGGPIADILCDTGDPILTKPRARYLAKRALTLEALHRQLADAIRTDPVLLAPALDGRRVLLVTALFDRTILPRYSRQLWDALGRPERLWLPFGHYSSLIAIPHVQTLALRFFRRTLDLPPTTLPRQHWRHTDEDGIMPLVPSSAP